MKTRTVLMDFGQEIFGESQSQQVRGGHARPPKAIYAAQIADFDERTGVMSGKEKKSQRRSWFMKSNRSKRTMTLFVGAISLALSAMTNADEAKSISTLLA